MAEGHRASRLHVVHQPAARGVASQHPAPVRAPDGVSRARTREPDAVERARQSLLPRTYLYPGVTLTAFVDTRSAAGGDFYVVEPIPDGRLLIVVGDVTGHGLTASVVMNLVYGLVARLAGQFGQATEVLDCVSENMCNLLPSTDEGVFATMLVSYLDPAGRVFHAARAGHWPPVAVSASGDARVLPLPNGLPCGVERSCGASAVDLTLSAGETVVLYTDGITESRSPAGAQFGVEGILQALGDAARDHQTVNAELVRDAAARFRGGGPASDDSTVVAVTLD